MPNAKVLESKKTVVDALSEKIQNATSAVFVDYKGITVAQDTELRNQFRAAGVEYAVVKNTLAKDVRTQKCYHLCGTSAGRANPVTINYLLLSLAACIL